MKKVFLITILQIVLCGCAILKPTPSGFTRDCYDDGQHGLRCNWIRNEDMPAILARRAKEERFKMLEISCWSQNNINDCCNDGIAREEAQYSPDETIKSYKRACDAGQKGGCDGVVRMQELIDDRHVRIGKCYFSYPFGCIVNQKIDDHHLGLVCRGGSYAGYVTQEPGNNKHAILEVEQIRFYGIGPINTGIQFAGTTVLKLDNGFDTVFDLWKECQPQPPTLPPRPSCQ